MSANPTTFHLISEDYPILSAELDQAPVIDRDIVLGELEKCSFEIHNMQSGQEYQVRIGDIPAEGVPRRYRGDLCWEEKAYMESAAGQVMIVLESRAQVADPWQNRATLVISVVPDKLSYTRYLSMIEDLRTVSSGLVFDLISKSFRSLQLVESGGWGMTSRTANLELRVLEKVWADVSVCLREIVLSPVTRLHLKRQYVRYLGAERLNQTSLRELTRSGVNPRRSHTGAVSVLTERLEESTDTPEHRIIAGFLRFLRARTNDCKARAEASIEAIESDRVVRDVRIAPGPTLYESVDIPRLNILRQASWRATQLEEKIAEAQRHSIFRVADTTLGLPVSPVFDYVGPYHHFRSVMLGYLRSSLVVLDAGLEERIKSTHRMYEQWVFLQIAASLRQAGLVCDSYVGLLRRTGVYRFTIDLERNTTILYRSGDGRLVRIRYEPFIYSFPDAIARGETLYRGIRGDTPWCPDLVIEVCAKRELPNEPLRPEYVIVLDAKYSKSVAEHHWADVDKYRQIRAVHDRSAVVKQLWIVHPSDNEPLCRDPGVEWLTSGPNRPRSELIEGVVGLLPPQESSESPDETNEGAFDRPAGAFVRAMLTYLGLTKEQVRSAAS